MVTAVSCQCGKYAHHLLVWLPYTPTHVLLYGTFKVMGLGYVLLRATVPTPEETYDAMAPDLRRKVDENRRARQAFEEGMKQQQNAQVCFTKSNRFLITYLVFRMSLQLDPESAKPVWADPPKR
ncbi:hypothetical protein BJV78DRAFT_1122478 [Lactifluus subvellereus]|nr:hypothetical protein BJV78DRAFT_1122478 [Lactifluus subvellereus]